MKKILITAMILAASLVTPALGAEKKASSKDLGCMGECTSCHKLSNDEALKLLKGDKFGLKILEIKPSAVKGLWEITMSQKGQSFLVYIDFSKKHLVEGVRATPLDRIGEQEPLRVVDTSKIPLDNAIVVGDPNAPKKIIVFDDPDCPYCKKLHADIKQIVEKRKDISFFIKMFPLPIHPKAYEKSKAVVCAKSLKLLDDAIDDKNLPAASCETSELEDNKKLGADLDIHGTPAIILQDGRLIPGYIPAAQLEDLIDNPDTNAKKSQTRKSPAKSKK